MTSLTNKYHARTASGQQVTTIVISSQPYSADALAKAVAEAIAKAAGDQRIVSTSVTPYESLNSGDAMFPVTSVLVTAVTENPT